MTWTSWGKTVEWKREGTDKGRYASEGTGLPLWITREAKTLLRYALQLCVDVTIAIAIIRLSIVTHEEVFKPHILHPQGQLPLCHQVTHQFSSTLSGQRMVLFNIHNWFSSHDGEREDGRKEWFLDHFVLSESLQLLIVH